LRAILHERARTVLSPVLSSTEENAE
jgi:hypothetical protein